MNKKMIIGTIISFIIVSGVLAYFKDKRERKEMEEMKTTVKEMNKFANHLVNDAFPQPNFEFKKDEAE